MKHRRVVVLGAGVAGLAAAYRIRRAAKERGTELELLVLDAGSKVGGKIETLEDDGFVCETGPNGFLDNEPATLRLVDDLGLRDDLQRSSDSARRRFLVRKGQLVEMHMNPVKFMKSPLLSTGAKLRMAGEYWVKPKQDDADETVGAFGRRRLGREFTEVMLDSMVSGIFAGDVDRLSVAAAFPKIIDLEQKYGGLFRGMAAKRKEVRARKKSQAAENVTTPPAATDPSNGEAPRKVEAGPGGVLHSFREGMGQPIRALARELGDRVIRTSTAVARIERRDDDFLVHLAEGEALEADAVVVCLPAPAASQVLRGVADEASEALAGVHVAGVHVVHLGVRKDQVRNSLEGFGALIPRREGIRTLGSIFTSSTFEGRAPKGYALLTNMIGGRHDPDADALDDDQLRQQVLDDIGPLLGIDGEPVFTRVIRWARGIPQYELGHLERVQRARDDVDRVGGLFLGGNSVAGVSFNHCVLHAESLGHEVVDYLADSPATAREGEATS